MQIKLIFDDCDHVLFVPAEELVRRLLEKFPATVVDWERGTAHVEFGLDRLIRANAPEVIVNDHLGLVGKVVHVTVVARSWLGARATSYLEPIRPPLGDAVIFDVEGTVSKAEGKSIGRDLGNALDMVVLLD